jgi:hypothetical protein
MVGHTYPGHPGAASPAGAWPWRSVAAVWPVRVDEERLVVGQQAAGLDLERCPDGPSGVREGDLYADNCLFSIGADRGS